jgi:hypothetical protein
MIDMEKSSELFDGIRVSPPFFALGKLQPAIRKRKIR